VTHSFARSSHRRQYPKSRGPFSRIEGIYLAVDTCRTAKNPETLTTNDHHRRGAAFHEAGHVAWSFGLQVGDILIGIDGDDTKGGVQIASEQDLLPKIDRLAVCFAGIEAQEFFGSPTHDLAGLTDLARANDIIGEDVSEEEGLVLRQAAHERAREKIVENEAQCRRLAAHLLKHGQVSRAKFVRLMMAESAAYRATAASRGKLSRAFVGWFGSAELGAD
jgi:hypothetical protein